LDLSEFFASSSSFRVCVETAHPSSLHISMMWFSYESGSLIWGIAHLGYRCLHSSRPTDFNKRRENALDRSLANKPELDRPSSHFFGYSNQPRETRMSDLCLNPKKYGISPIGFRPKEGQVGQKTQASSGVVFFCCAGPL
jgi:hypothetical protein